MTTFYGPEMPNVRVTWEIFRSEGVKEDFRFSSVWMFLQTQDNLRVVLPVEVGDGVLTATLPGKLPDGIYGFKAIWVKNTHTCRADYIGTDSRRMVSETEAEFQVTSFRESATPIANEPVVIALQSMVASYGLDGLDAYEKAVMMGVTASEEDWIKTMNEAAKVGNVNVELDVVVLTVTNRDGKKTTSKIGLSPAEQQNLIQAADNATAAWHRADAAADATNAAIVKANTAASNADAKATRSEQMAEKADIAADNAQAMADNAFRIGKQVSESCGKAISDLNQLIGEAGAHMQINKVTYDELKTLRDNGELAAGAWYQITDYECTTVQEETRSAQHPFDIIVLAIDDHTLSEVARAVKSERDQSYYVVMIESLNQCFCVSNSAVRWSYNGHVYEGYLWISAPSYEDAVRAYNTAGSAFDCVITYQTPFDATLEITGYTLTHVVLNENKMPTTISGIEDTIRFNSYAKVNTAYFADCHPEAWKIWYCIDNDEARFAWADAENGKGVIYRMIDEHGNEAPYDFKNILFLRKCTAGQYDPDGGVDTWVYTFSAYHDGRIKDGSILVYTTPLSSSVMMHDNKIQNFRPSLAAQALNGNVIINDMSAKASLCRNNVFEANTFYNTLGTACSSNVFMNGCNGNTIGNACHRNTFGEECARNVLGDNCNGNVFSGGCNRNVLGLLCANNSFGIGCSQNELGISCSCNTFGNDCISNKFGNASATKSYMSYVTLEAGVWYTYINCTATTSSSDPCRNIHVCSGVKGASGTNRKTIEVVTAGNTYLTTFGTANDVKVNV